MPTVLITGANRGIGLEFARQYAADNWTVVAACRVPDKADELQALAAQHSAVSLEALNVGDDASIAALAAKLKDMAIDVLINNAGIYSGAGKKVSAVTGDKTQDFGTIDSAAWAKVLRINTIAPIMVAQAFVPHVKAGKDKKIINISSRMGSLAEMGAGSLAYRSSKSALNAAMLSILAALRDQGISIVNFHPGWVKTDMGSQQADLTPQQSVSGMRQVIASLQPENSGQFLSYDGQKVSW